MALTVNLTGSGTIGPLLPGWSVTEDATPVAPGDTSGGVGAINFEASHGEDSEFIIGNALAVEADGLGTISGGSIVSLGSAGAYEHTHTAVSATGTTGLTLLNATRTFGPFWEGMNSDLAPFIASGSSLQQINVIRDIAVDEVRNRVFVVGDVPDGIYTTGRILQYTTDGQFRGSLAESYWTSAATGANAYSVGVDPSTGDIFVGFYWTAPGIHQTFKINPDLAIITGIYGPGDNLYAPVGISCDGTNIYATGQNGVGGGTILKTSLTGSLVDSEVLAGGRKAWGMHRSGSTLWAITTDSSDLDVRVARFDLSLNQLSEVAVSAPGGTSVTKDATIWALSSTEALVGSWANSTGGWNAYVNRIDDTGAVLESTSISGIPYGAAVEPRFAMIGSTLFVADGTSSPINVPTPRLYPVVQDAATSLSSAVRYYLDHLDASMALQWDATVDPEVNIPGFAATGWDALKQVGTAYGIEFAWVEDGIVARDVGSLTLSLDNVEAGSVNLSLDATATGLSVDFNATNAEAGLGLVMYDAQDDGNIIQVEAGQTTTITVQTTNHPTVLSSPYPTDTLPAPPGSYRVIGSDNLPVVAAQWIAYGGNVFAAPSTTTPGAIDITITGPSAIPGVPGPYSFAVSDGSTTYPQFSIIGNGVTTNPETINILSGADPNRTTEQVASEVNNIFLANRAHVYDRCTWSLAQASGPVITLTATIPTSQINGFGLTAGSLLTFKESTYRVVSASIGNETTDITATRHVTVEEFDNLMAAGSVTVGDFDTFWDGNACEDLKIKSLREVS